MKKCPIAKWKKLRPNALALGQMTYRELDLLVRKMCRSLDQIKSPVISILPRHRIEDVALFFAAWRLGKTVYPINHRIPPEELFRKITRVGGQLVDPKTLLHEVPLDKEDVNTGSLATLLDTSSGSKTCCHTLGNHTASAEIAIEVLKINLQSCVCLNLPLFHVSGIATMLRTFLAGAKLVFASEIHSATHISMVPTQLHNNQNIYPRLQCLLVGGAPIAVTVYEQVLKKWPIFLTYGMTEASSMILFKPPHENAVVLRHIELKLANDGEVLIRGPSVFSHYFGEGKRDPRSWFATKDKGVLTPEGDIQILGRMDRQFISGGENIQPEEIERILLEDPQVLEARVDPLPDAKFGMIPKLHVQSHSKLSQEAIRRKLEKHLPQFMVPQEIEIRITPIKGSKQNKMI